MKVIKCKVAFFCLIVFMLTANYSSAEPAGKHTRLFLTNEMAARGAPRLGAADTVELNYHYYYSGSDSILFRNNHLGLGLTDSLSPATNYVGAFIEIEPVAVFNLRLQYEYVQYFGVLVATLIFPDKDSNYSDSIQEDKEAESATGHHFSIWPTFQIQYDRFVALNMLGFEWWVMNKDDYFYEPSNDTLMKTNEYFFINTVIAGFEVWKRDENRRVILGTRYTHFRVDSTDRIRKQLDGVMIWMMGEKRRGMEKPLLVMAVGGFLEDRYREKDIFIGLVFNFEYSILPRQ
jgi:hypothetical protein